MKTKHTPGTWIFHPHHTKKKKRWLLDNRPEGEKGSSVFYHVAYWDISESDRKLIAAAPELLEACLTIQNYLGHPDTWKEAEYILAAQLQKAIAKAI